jgi:hypothetical protein
LRSEPAQRFHHGDQRLAQRAWDAPVFGVAQDHQQLIQPATAGGRHYPEFRHQATQLVFEHCALLDQQIAHPVDPGQRLLLIRLDRDKAHRRTAHRLADRCRVRRIVLVAPHIGLGVSRRDQSHLVPQLLQLTPPVMGRRARLNPDQARRLLGKPCQHLRAPQGTTNRHRAGAIDPMHLKHILGDIQADYANLFHGWLPFKLVFSKPTLAQRCREGAIHPIIARRAATKQSRGYGSQQEASV